MKYIIDRFEGDYAVIELKNGTHADMPRSLIPTNAKEGDTLNITVDAAETAERAKRINTLMDDLFS